MENVNEKISRIDSKEDFLYFLIDLIADFRHNRDEWENKSLESYLDAMASWIADMEGFYMNNNIPVPTSVDWKFFARILIAAKMYE
ncbi:DUF7660 family protein [Chitinophaga japonensis]|uniref:DUF7660 domain-containing protein n=1 Tax=Chitinophaga japonensis TaxID=104662 RepID=A0A562T5S2_CHIJA|nr:hypothetical protein [Chitinophaga japonensis]TWI88875.1 hypothetical protein LX66_2963 [Chitinophaga japonensis]